MKIENRVPQKATTLVLQQAWQNSLREIIDSAPQGVPVLQIETLAEALKAKHTLPSIQGMLVRVGRAFARHLIPELRLTESKLNAQEFHLMPRGRKIEHALKHTVSILNATLGKHLETYREGNILGLRLGEKNTPQESLFWSGFLQEATYWASGGLFLPVHIAEDLQIITVQIKGK